MNTPTLPEGFEFALANAQAKTNHIRRLRSNTSLCAWPVGNKKPDENVRRPTCTLCQTALAKLSQK